MRAVHKEERPGASRSSRREVGGTHARAGAIRRGVVLASLGAMSLAAPAARADGPSKDACISANESLQVSQRAGQFREARRQIAVCMSEACPAVLRSDCADHLAEIDRLQPTIVFDARDTRGARRRQGHRRLPRRTAFRDRPRRRGAPRRPRRAHLHLPARRQPAGDEDLRPQGRSEGAPRARGGRRPAHRRGAARRGRGGTRRCEQQRLGDTSRARTWSEAPRTGRRGRRDPRARDRYRAPPWVVAVSKWSNATSACPHPGPCADYQEGQADRSGALDAATGSTIGFVVEAARTARGRRSDLLLGAEDRPGKLGGLVAPGSRSRTGRRPDDPARHVLMRGARPFARSVQASVLSASALLAGCGSITRRLRHRSCGGCPSRDAGERRRGVRRRLGRYDDRRDGGIRRHCPTTAGLADVIGSDDLVGPDEGSSRR